MLLLLLVATATVILTEVASRAVRNFVCVGSGTYMAYADADFGWTHVPGITYLDQRCRGRDFEFRQHVAINSKGLRDREYEDERTPGVARVLVLGDSVVEAAQVAPDEPWTEVLEAELAKGGARVEVINAGHAGWSTHHQAAWYEKEGRRYAADLVVSQFNIQNDVSEIAPAVHARLYAGSGMPELPAMSVDERGHLVVDTTRWKEFAERKRREMETYSPLRHALRENFYALRWLERLFDRSPGSEHGGPTVAADPGGTGPLGVFAAGEPDADWREGWTFVEAGYRRLRDAVRADGASFAVVVMPSREVVDPTSWGVLALAMPALASGDWDLEGPGRRIRDFLGREGIGFVDLAPPMKAAFEETGRHGFFDIDVHPTAEGHRRIAAAMLAPVRRGLGLGAARDGGAEAEEAGQVRGNALIETSR